MICKTASSDSPVDFIRRLGEDGVTVEVDDSIDLHVELPAGIELSSPGATSDAVLRRVEREG